MSDGWEALTQQEAMEDARVAYIVQALYEKVDGAHTEQAETYLLAVVRERDQAQEALREADRILAWWHGTFEPHTRRAWSYDACEPCRPIREQVRAALVANRAQEEEDAGAGA